MPSHDPDQFSSRLVRVLTLLLPVLLVFGVTVFAATLVVGWVAGTTTSDPWTISLGILCTLVIWCFVTIFHIKKDSALLPFQRRDAFLQGIKVHLEQLGYEAHVRKKDQITFTPAFHSFLFGGSIELQVEGKLARITGPKLYLERLRQGLRMQTYLEKVQQTYQESRQRQGEQLLKRVQISLRATDDQWEDIHEQVIQVLKQEDATVVCEVNILAQSELGIRESTVESLIRTWLKKEEIQAEILKEEVQKPAQRQFEAPVALSGETIMRVADEEAKQAVEETPAPDVTGNTMPT